MDTFRLLLTWALNANLANLELNDDATENFLRVNEGSNGKSFAALCLGAHLLEK